MQQTLNFKQSQFTALQWISNQDQISVTWISEHPPAEDHWYIMVRRKLITDEWTEDAGDECRTQDVGINTYLPVIEQLEGRIMVLERDSTTEG